MPCITSHILIWAEKALISRDLIFCHFARKRKKYGPKFKFIKKYFWLEDYLPLLLMKHRYSRKKTGLRTGMLGL